MSFQTPRISPPQIAFTEPEGYNETLEQSLKREVKMSLEYRFDYVNLEPTKTLEDLAQKKLKSLEKRVDKRTREPIEIHVRFVVDSRSAFGNLKSSHVVMEVKVPGIPKKLVSTKKDSDLRVAVSKTSEALLKEVRRFTEKLEHTRRH